MEIELSEPHPRAYFRRQPLNPAMLLTEEIDSSGLGFAQQNENGYTESSVWTPI